MQQTETNDHSETRVLKLGISIPAQGACSPGMSIPDRSIDRRIEEAADAALSEADLLCERENRYPTIAGMAEAIYSGRPDLMEEAKKPVLLDRLQWVLKRRKLARFQEEFHQMDLPGLELPRTVFLRNGSRPRLDLCTAPEIDNAIRVLEGNARERETPKLRRLKIARQIMDPYLLGQPKIHWGEVKKKELERRDFNRLVGE